jgi:hypothetical protein
MSGDAAAASNDVAQTIAAVGGLAGLVSAIGAIIVSLRSKAEAGQARSDATVAKADATTAKADASTAMAKALEAIQKAEDAQTKAQVGALELQLRVFLSSRRDRIQEVSRDLEAIRGGRRPEDLSDVDKTRMKDAMQRFISAHEDLLNALEQACRHLRDDKIDAVAFRRMYDDEVRTVCEAGEDSPFHKFMGRPETTKFRAIWATYREWFDLEKKN